MGGYEARPVLATDPPPAPPFQGGELCRFTPNATRLAGLAGLMFGWAPDTFWTATPAELAALVGAAAGDAAEPGDADLAARLMEMFPDG